jgi:hypothetical protein
MSLLEAGNDAAMMRKTREIGFELRSTLTSSETRTNLGRPNSGTVVRWLSAPATGERVKRS